jgi:hypothetical protein
MDFFDHGDISGQGLCWHGDARSRLIWRRVAVLCVPTCLGGYSCFLSSATNSDCDFDQELRDLRAPARRAELSCSLPRLLPAHRDRGRAHVAKRTHAKASI